MALRVWSWPSPRTGGNQARNRLKSSFTFARSRRLIKLLEVTIDSALDGRAQDIKEYTIGTEVYERGPDFDPRADGIVRVEANRLRHRLAEYYEGAGQGDPIRIRRAPTFRNFATRLRRSPLRQRRLIYPLT